MKRDPIAIAKHWVTLPDTWELYFAGKYILDTEADLSTLRRASGGK